MSLRDYARKFVDTIPQESYTLLVGGQTNVFALKDEALVPLVNDRFRAGNLFMNGKDIFALDQQVLYKFNSNFEPEKFFEARKGFCVAKNSPPGEIIYGHSEIKRFTNGSHEVVCDNSHSLSGIEYHSYSRKIVYFYDYVDFEPGGKRGIQGSRIETTQGSVLLDTQKQIRCTTISPKRELVYGNDAGEIRILGEGTHPEGKLIAKGSVPHTLCYAKDKLFYGCADGSLRQVGRGRKSSWLPPIQKWKGNPVWYSAAMNDGKVYAANKDFVFDTDGNVYELPEKYKELWSITDILPVPTQLLPKNI